MITGDSRSQLSLRKQEGLREMRRSWLLVASSQTHQDLGEAFWCRSPHVPVHPLSFSAPVAAHPQAGETSDQDSTKKWQLVECISSGLTGSNPLAKTATRAGNSLINILRCTFWDKMKELKTACCVECVFSWYFLAFFPLYFWQDAYLNFYWNMKVKVNNPYGI